MNLVFFFVFARRPTKQIYRSENWVALTMIHARRKHEFKFNRILLPFRSANVRLISLNSCAFDSESQNCYCFYCVCISFLSLCGFLFLPLNFTLLVLLLLLLGFFLNSAASELLWRYIFQAVSGCCRLMIVAATK